MSRTAAVNDNDWEDFLSEPQSAPVMDSRTPFDNGVAWDDLDD
jgi:hypothetical protein